jgi:chromosome segregation ATPase
MSEALFKKIDEFKAERKQILAELSTWKARAEEFKRLHEQRNNHELNPNIPDCDCPVCNVHRRLQKAEAERDTLKARCEKLEGYAEHKPTCGKNMTSSDESKLPCTCGLDEYLK